MQPEDHGGSRGYGLQKGCGCEEQSLATDVQEHVAYSDSIWSYDRGSMRLPRTVWCAEPPSSTVISIACCRQTTVHHVGRVSYAVPHADVSPQQDTMSIVFRGVVRRRPLRGCCCRSRWQALDRYIQRACGSRRILRSRRSPRFGGGDQCGSVVCVVTRRGRSQCPGVDPACEEAGGEIWPDKHLGL